MAKKKLRKKAPAEGEPTFEGALSELEQVVAALEGGDLGLDEALAHYERGVARLRTLQRRLAEAERRIELVTGVGPDGSPVTRPFEAADPPASDVAAGPRARKRSAAGVDAEGRLF